MGNDVHNTTLGQGAKDDGKIKKKIKESFVNATKNKILGYPKIFGLKK